MEYLRIENRHNLDIVDNKGFYILTSKSIIFCNYERPSSYTTVCELNGIKIQHVKSNRELNKVFFVTVDNLIKTFSPGDSELKDISSECIQNQGDSITNIFFNSCLQYSTKTTLCISKQVLLHKCPEDKICNVINDLILVQNLKTFSICKVDEKEKKKLLIQHCKYVFKDKFNSKILHVESKMKKNILKLAIVLDNCMVIYKEFNITTNQIINTESIKWFGSEGPNCVSFSHISDKLYLGGKEGVLMIWDVHSGFKQMIPRFGAVITFIVETADLDLIITLETGVVYYIRALDNTVIGSLGFVGYYKNETKTKQFPSISENAIGGELINGLYQIFNTEKNKEMYSIDFQQRNKTYTMLNLHTKKFKKGKIVSKPKEEEEEAELVDVIHVYKKLFYSFYNTRNHESKIPIIRILGCDNGVLVFKEDIKMKRITEVNYDAKQHMFTLDLKIVGYSNHNKMVGLSSERTTFVLKGYSLVLNNTENKNV